MGYRINADTIILGWVTWCAGITAALIASIVSFGSFSPQPAEAEVGV